jgi:hypothetical protein
MNYNNLNYTQDHIIRGKKINDADVDVLRDIRKRNVLAVPLYLIDVLKSTRDNKSADCTMETAVGKHRSTFKIGCRLQNPNSS